jgi:hypothetical protein
MTEKVNDKNQNQTTEPKVMESALVAIENTQKIDPNIGMRKKRN